MFMTCFTYEKNNYCSSPRLLAHARCRSTSARRSRKPRPGNHHGLQAGDPFRGAFRRRHRSHRSHKHPRGSGHRRWCCVLGGPAAHHPESTARHYPWTSSEEACPEASSCSKTSAETRTGTEAGSKACPGPGSETGTRSFAQRQTAR